MKNKQQTKLSLDKLTISKLQDASLVLGGDTGTQRGPTTISHTKHGTVRSTKVCRPGGGGSSKTCKPNPVFSTKACS